MRSPRLFLFGIAVTAVGVSPLLYSEYRLNHNWVPLTMTIPSIAGDVKTPEFVPDYTGTYVVTLAFDPKDVDRQECLLGDRLDKDSCNTPGGGLGLLMSVAEDDRLIVDHLAYKPYGFGGVGEITTELGRFEATRNQRCRIVLNKIQMAPELLVAHPRLKVSAHWAAWEPWVIWKQLGFWIAIVVAPVGLMCAVAATGWF